MATRIGIADRRARRRDPVGARLNGPPATIGHVVRALAARQFTLAKAGGCIAANEGGRRVMRNVEETVFSRLSRRALLIGGAAAGAAPMFAPTRALASAKFSQARVGYSDSPTGDHHCGNCRFFRAPSSCLAVAGVVTEHCSCTMWLPKVG
jgi:hypothetical protein